MRLLFDACIFAVVSSVVVGFAPVRSGGRIANVGLERTARFVAMSPLDNWTDEEDDDDDYDIHSTYSESIISSPGVVISVCKLIVRLNKEIMGSINGTTSCD
jgi:hypothetical protein